MGCGMSKEEAERRFEAMESTARAQFESQSQLLQQLDSHTKVPHLLIELRNLGYVEVCGKDTGGIYQRLDTFLREHFRCTDATMVLKVGAAESGAGCCGMEAGLVTAMYPRQPWDQVCDAMYVCGQQQSNGRVIPNGVYKAVGSEGQTNMGKLTMDVVDFMTNQCGWGLQLVDGGNNGFYGQIRDQQIKFKAPHPLNLIAPHMMVELRQVGFIEINGPDSQGIYGRLADWFKRKWGATPIAAPPDICKAQFRTSAFKSRGTEGENNMGMRTMELVDFMVQECAWTLITCNGGNFGRTGAKREQQLIFRNDEHVQHGENHVMFELRDVGYLEVNGLHDAEDIVPPLEDYVKRLGGREYQQGMWEKEKYCDKKYVMPSVYFWKDHELTNNLGKRTIELAFFMGSLGWMLMLCNGGNISNYQGFQVKREQQIKFTKARPVDNPTAPLLMIEMRTVPRDQWGNFQGFIEVNGPDTNGIYQKLSNYITSTMMGAPQGRTAYCDYLFTVNCFRQRDSSTTWDDRKYNGLQNGENNFGKYTMRLCDFMVDHIGEWDMVVCNGNSIDRVFRINKDNTISVTSREQQLIFRHRPGGRAVFMSMDELKPLGRAPLQPPHYWRPSTKAGTTAQEMVAATPEEKEWLQALLDGTYKKKATRDRAKGSLADRFVMVSALRSEHPALWDKYAKRRAEVLKSIRENGEGSEFVAPKTIAAAPGLSERLKHPKLGNPTNEGYLLHGTNPTSAQAILGTSFKVNLAGASAGTMFGPGVYLAEASSKADEYARDENTGGAYDGLFAMLVCRCCIGRAFVVEKSGNYAEQVTSGLFDVVVGDREKAVGTYREFVFFHEGSMYPEYAIFYRREGGDPPASPAGGGGAAIAMPAPTVAPPPAVIRPGGGNMMDVQVPEGAVPGQTLQVTAPDGKTVQVQIPEGFGPGSTMRVAY